MATQTERIVTPSNSSCESQKKEKGKYSIEETPTFTPSIFQLHAGPLLGMKKGKNPSGWNQLD
jgi:hypothetical protein